MSSLARQRLTPREYLEIERRAATKSEYFDGRMWAMAGAKWDHNVIVGNVTAELRQALRGRPCQVAPNDTRITVSDTGLYTYPDIVVVCGEVRFEDGRQDTILNPILLVEVLFESTEEYDRDTKFEHYRRLESLRDYVMVSSERVRVECYSRQADGTWRYAEATHLEGTIEFPSLESRFDLAEIYYTLNLPSSEEALRGPRTRR
jgi:Uma2 family endonuclease